MIIDAASKVSSQMYKVQYEWQTCDDSEVVWVGVYCLSYGFSSVFEWVEQFSYSP